MEVFNYKQWHDEGLVFHQEKLVDFSLAGSDKFLHLHELLKLTSDAAVEDYNRRGMSREFLVEHNTAILVARNSFRFHRLPQENERIEIITWEEKPEALQLMRAYEIKSESGEKLVSGISGWLVVDLEKRRMIPSKNFTLRAAPTVQKEHDCLPCGKISVPFIGSGAGEMVLIGERKIGKSDLDANGHTNNARYAAFIMDFLPVEYAEKTFFDFRLNYSKEAMFGETLKLFAGFDDGAKKIVVVGKTDAATSFESEIFYK